LVIDHRQHLDLDVFTALAGLGLESGDGDD
jgi:hypothetical protein